VCTNHCAQLSYTTQHRTDLIIFPSNLQTIITALMLSIGGEGAVGWLGDKNAIRLVETLCHQGRIQKLELGATFSVRFSVLETRRLQRQWGWKWDIPFPVE